MKRCELCRCRATSYCEADRAYLCWDCDAKVHGANFLVARHDRCLLCRACQSLTPWRASGSAWLGHASSLCSACSSTDKAPSLVGCGASSEVTDIGSPPSCSEETSSSSSSSSSLSCSSSAGDARGLRKKRCRDGNNNNNRSSTQRVGREREAARDIDSSLKRRKKNGLLVDRTD